jgi:RNA polymerase-binding transcription factor
MTGSIYLSLHITHGILPQVEEATMQLVELERSKTLLRTLLRELEQPLRKRDEIAVDNPPDTIDRVQHAAERELAILQIESNFHRLQSIRLALQRIEDGTYGTCMGCEETIGDKRLHAVPWASYCLRCQDIADHEGKPDEELLRAF